MAIQLKSLDEIKLMRAAGKIVWQTLTEIKKQSAIGVTTEELDQLAREILSLNGATSSFLGYHGYPSVICASVNEEVVHGIPNKRKLQNGDLLSIDFGAIVDGWHADAAISFGIGEVDAADQN
jgi:methionyl aminopeptidase